MDRAPSLLQSTSCTIRRVRWSRATSACDHCNRPAARAWDVTRVAIDIDLDQPVLLAVVVSVHRCRPCRRYFRAQPPFLRVGATYTDRVVLKAVQSVHQDGMAMRRVSARLARDFWVRPSEKMVRLWCQTHADALDFATDYQPWVVESFSGILCVDEVYQGKLALLLAVDPAAPDGDRLVGYELVQGTVDQGAMGAFLRRLAATGIRPDQVITDGSALYPSLLAEIWPTAAHQLCLFHETRRVTAAVDEVAKAVQRALPKPPPTTRATLGGRPRTITPPTDASDTATERWRWRESTRQAGRARVHELRGRGLSVRAIARQTGFNRRTVTAWLKHEAPPQTDVAHPEPPPTSPAAPDATPPPEPWASWDEIRQAREHLKKGRPLLLRRADHLTAGEQAQLDALLAGPTGADLRLARAFLEAWYGLWRDQTGQRRPLTEAQERYERWRTDPEFARLAPLRRVQQSVDPTRFARLSHFLTDPAWEATNNGAERMGRSFRHKSAPHFNLRTTQAIDDALKIGAFLKKAAATAVAPVPANRSPRGRARRQDPLPLAA
ncbi:MAG TPA: hypothetical protein VFR13_01400 [Jiangellaceae bacterium]|nr:hypothetical protein [Jiangellaceae bacterium]